MEKVIGGRVVKIDNFEFISEAFKGKQRPIQHGDVARILDFIDMNLIKDCVDCYYKVMDKLIFPLDYFEREIKYNTIALCMKHIAKEDGNEELLEHLEDSNTIINVTNGLTISIDEYTALEFIGYSWRMIDIQYGIDNELCELKEYEGYLGYEEYCWAIQRVFNGQDLDGYYMKFMPDLWEVCDGKLDTVMKELDNILKLENYGKVVNCNDYQFIDLDNKLIHHMVIKSVGKVAINQERLTLRFGENGLFEGSKYKKLYKNSYDYELHTMDFNNNTKNYGTINGLDKILQMIVGRHNEDIYNAKFKGYMFNGYVVFEFDGDIYMCLRDEEDVDVIELAYGSKIVDIQDNCVYYKRDNAYYSEVLKDDLVTGTTSLCEIIYG